jgi:hypothetical protein
MHGGPLTLMLAARRDVMAGNFGAHAHSCVGVAHTHKPKRKAPHESDMERSNAG